jgi:hypothetical protein
MRAADPELPIVVSREDARAAGMSYSTVGRRLRDEQWSRLRRGWYSPEQLEADVQWRAEVLAVVRTHRRPLVLSHAHAARAHGWPAPLGGWGPMSFTATLPPARRRAHTCVLVAALEDHEVVQRGVVLVTSPARTLVDCARHLPAHDALAMADRALRRRDVSASSLTGALHDSAGRPGIERARQVLTLADGRRETPVESWSAWAFRVQGLPAPRWQATVLDDEGVFLGRTDAWWKQGVAGEADGRAKYRLAALERTGTVDAEGLAGALDDERRRERELRQAGVIIVRWEPRDVLQSDRQRRLAAQLRRELDVARTRPRFMGKVLGL